MRVLVLDDEEVVAAGVSRLLESAGHHVVYRRDAASALEVLRGEEAYDLVLLDVHLGGSDGIALVPALVEASPTTRVLLLTGDQDPGLVGAGLKSGAAGVLRKTAKPAELLSAVEVAGSGGAVLAAEDVAAVLEGPRRRGPLSAREHEVLRLMDSGLSTSGMAARLVVSEHTVRGHVQSILRKLDAGSRVTALAVARRQGLLGAPDRR